MNQHFVPRFLIENFVDPQSRGNRGVWVYRASTQQWSKRPTRRTASLDDFYTFLAANGDSDNTYEDFMEKIETLLSPFVRDGIERRRRLSPPQPYDVFVAFCALLICRNPQTVRRTRDALVRRAYAELDRHFSTPEAFQKMRAEYHQHTGKDFPNFVDPRAVLANLKLDATHEAAIGFAGLALSSLNEVLGKCRVTFLCAPESSSFITSDVPYDIRTDNSGEISNVCVPLSPRTAALFVPDTNPM